MKKVFKIIIGILFFLLLAIILIPIIFQDKIVAIIKEKINDNIHAKVEFTNASLSLIRNFPNASLHLSDVSVTNFTPFEGDTLFFGKEIGLQLNLTDILNTENLNIKSFNVDNAKINIKTDKKGQANYNITKNAPNKSTDTNSLNDKKTMKFSIQSYEISNSEINYNDEKGKISVQLTNFNHSGTGDFSQNRTELDTQTSSNIYFNMGGKTYAENLYLDLVALLDLDLTNKKFSFLKNKAHINQLPLNFNGFVKLNDSNQEVEVTFKTPSSDFKNFLALVPKAYTKNIRNVTTTGNFNVSGTVNGIISNKRIPKINININSDNASFKYPDLPKGVDNIHINTNIKNNTGLVTDTYIDINNLSFKIDENTFTANAKIKNLTKNPIINARAKGKLNLTDINKVFPLKTENKLSGLIDADLTTQFDSEALQKNIYQRIKNNGKISINDFIYSSDDVVNPINIKNAEVAFDPSKISLTNFEAKTGKTDLNAKGSIENLLGFLLSNKKLKGNFKLNSNEFRISDFMEVKDKKEAKENDPSSNKKQQESLKIPAFLNCSVTARAKKVFYDDLELENAQGILLLKDEKAILQNVTADMFDGKIALNGTVNTQQKTPVFNMKMGIKSFNISKSFEKLELFKMLAPISSIIQGKLNTTLDLKGSLKNDFTPDLNSIGGNAFAQVLSQKLNPEKSSAMSLLSSNLKFIDFKKLNLDNIKAHLNFKDGKVNVKPFNLKYKDIDIKLGGSHGFDQSMNYKVTLDVPAKYLGSEINNILSKLDSKNQNITVPVTANLAGNFKNPTISTNMSSAVNQLTTQLIAQQKTKLIGKVFGNSKSPKDSNTTKNVIKNKVNDVLEGLFGKKKN